jgi:1-pyrroline-5-carboxylate dehydrogenase
MEKLPAFQNEPSTDFSTPANRRAIDEALAKVRAQLGREYDLAIGGERLKTGDLLRSVNPSNPREVVGVHHRATAELARRAVDSAYAYFAEWSATPEEERIRLLVRAAGIIRHRKLEFDAWLVLEAGKTWPEADADVSEAIDFCEYYAREMQRLSGPQQPAVQLPGERGELRYLPLGVGVIIPPWNFPLAIMVGMTVASLVAGNTAIIKPSSETPTIGAKFAEVLLEAGFPEQSFCLLTGSGAAVGDAIVEHPKTRFVAFTGSRDVGLRINELAAKAQPGQLWIKRVIAEMGGKDAIVVDAECDLDKAVEGVAVSAFGYSGQKCSACSRAIVDAKVYDAFLDKLQARVSTIKVGEAEKPENYMGPVISDGARRTILQYIEAGRQEGRVLPVSVEAPAEAAEGYFVPPTVIADVDSKARIFQEEIFGPVLAVTTFKDEAEALRIANDTLYGLGAGVWSRDGSRAFRMGRGIKAGRVWTNCYHLYPAHAAFGGYKVSGVGRENHKMMLDHYSQTKCLLVSYDKNPMGFF